MGWIYGTISRCFSFDEHGGCLIPVVGMHVELVMRGWSAGPMVSGSLSFRKVTSLLWTLRMIVDDEHEISG